MPTSGAPKKASCGTGDESPFRISLSCAKTPELSIESFESAQKFPHTAGGGGARLDSIY